MRKGGPEEGDWHLAEQDEYIGNNQDEYTGDNIACQLRCGGQELIAVDASPQQDIKCSAYCLSVA